MTPVQTAALALFASSSSPPSRALPTYFYLDVRPLLLPRQSIEVCIDGTEGHLLRGWIRLAGAVDEPEERVTASLRTNTVAFGPRVGAALKRWGTEVREFRIEEDKIRVRIRVSRFVPLSLSIPRVPSRA